MCASYWNLDTKIKCPKCKKTSKWNLQTHWFGGDTGLMCLDYYSLGEKIAALNNMTVTLDRSNDWFISDCPKCKAFFDFGAKIEDGIVKEVFII